MNKNLSITFISASFFREAARLDKLQGYNKNYQDAMNRIRKLQ